MIWVINWIVNIIENRNCLLDIYIYRSFVFWLGVFALRKRSVEIFLHHLVYVVVKQTLGVQLLKRDVSGPLDTRTKVAVWCQLNTWFDVQNILVSVFEETVNPQKEIFGRKLFSINHLIFCSVRDCMVSFHNAS